MEITSTKYRATVGSALQIPWAMGYTLISGLAYWVKDWRTIQIISAGLYIVLIFFICILPESPRWLIVNNRVSEAEEIIRKACRMNNKDLPPDLEIVKHAERREWVRRKERASLRHLLKSPELLVRTIIVFIIWTVTALVYYGVTINVSVQSGDKEKRMFSGIKVLRLVFMLFGKAAAQAAFVMLYIYTSELYPTVIRNSVVGLSSMVARIGAGAAGYVAILSESTMQVVPMIIFGVFSFVAGTLVVFLPETLNQPLPDTLKDAVEILKQDYATCENPLPGMGMSAFRSVRGSAAAGQMSAALAAREHKGHSILSNNSSVYLPTNSADRPSTDRANSVKTESTTLSDNDEMN